MSQPNRKKRNQPTSRKADVTCQAADLAAFRRMMQAASGTFSLSCALCHDLSLQSSLIQRLNAEFPDILIVTLPANVVDVLAHVQSQIATPPAAIFILGLESSISFESEDQLPLSLLNRSRESWEHLHCPIVFWLAEYALARLTRHAPDFWRYRSHQFEFIPDDPSLDKARLESFPRQNMVDGLPYEEKLFRLSELQRRLEEAGNPPNSDLLPHVVLWSYELARLYQHSNRFEEAEQLLRQVVEWQAASHGEDGPQTAVALGNLAVLLQHSGALAEAETLMVRALAIDEASFDSNHLRVARSLNNLAQLLIDTNRFAEAEPLMRRALAITEAHYYSNDNPTIAIVLHNLGQLLKATKRMSEAEPLMRRALAIEEASYGSSHPNVARALNNLAMLLQATHRLTEAEPLMRRALAIEEASYGSSHPNVARALNNLAMLLQAANRLPEAEPLSRRALEVCRAALGPEHPNTQKTSVTCIHLLRAMNLPEPEISESMR
jgi:tetratricopeptide (TPR) repeat protein